MRFRSLLAAAFGAGTAILILHGSVGAATLEVCASCTYRTITEALSVAGDGDEVLVHSGTYSECITISESVTLRSTDGAAATVIDGESCQRPATVVRFTTGSENAVLDGFTVQHGEQWDSGGGIHVGVYASNAPQIRNCVVSNNSAQTGGGIAADDMSSPLISDCVIEGNSATQGGGIAVGRHTTVERTIIRGNQAEQMGGGVRLFYSSPLLSNCIITGNRVTGSLGYGWGGGVFIPGGMWPTIVNTTISGNFSDIAPGGGIYKNGSNGPFDPDPTMINSIVWGNGPSEMSAADLIVTYSDVQGGYPGIGNLDVDPLFTSALDSSVAPTSDGDYHLSSGDSLVVGGADGSTAPSDDIDGDLRPQGGSCDMGADEYVPSTVTITKASYNYLAHTLDVTATSPNGSSANLVLVGYGPMSWSSNKQHWAISASATAPPASVTVCGPLDGCKATE